MTIIYYLEGQNLQKTLFLYNLHFFLAKIDLFLYSLHFKELETAHNQRLENREQRIKVSTYLSISQYMISDRNFYSLFPIPYSFDYVQSLMIRKWQQLESIHEGHNAESGSKSLANLYQNVRSVSRHPISLELYFMYHLVTPEETKSIRLAQICAGMSAQKPRTCTGILIHSLSQQ